jgi:type VI protein secretion system component VasA
MTRTDDSVTMSVDEWARWERASRRWKLVGGLALGLMSCLATGAAWVRSDERAAVVEEVRQEAVSRRLAALEGADTEQTRRLARIESVVCRLAWLQGEYPTACGTP